jgi:PAS domain S-box-containing protein
MNVLVVEDDATSRLLLTRLISERGHRVNACPDAESAMAASESQLHPLILLDLMLPGMGGLDFCRWVRQQPWGAGVYILVATSCNQTDDLQSVLASGADDYLAKPFDIGLMRVRLSVAERRVEQIQAKRSSDQLRDTILRTAIDGYWLLDVEGNILDVNETYCRLVGYSREELTRMNAGGLEAPESPGNIRERLLHIRASGGDRYETRHRCRDGRCVDLLVNAGYVPTDGGRIFTFFRDITSHKRTAEERLKSSKLESIGLLAGGIAHDFNNVLTAIIGNLSLSEMELPPNHAAAGWLNNARAAAERATALARQLLTFAQGGAPIKKPVRIDVPVQRTAELSLHGTTIKGEFLFPPDLWEVEADIDQITQVIDNLLINAREAMPEGGRVRIEGRNINLPEHRGLDLSPGNYVCLSLTDQGPGIPPEVLPRIFDPYFSTKQRGAGLGLTTCYSIVRKHGGTLTAESVPGKYTRFDLYFPAVHRPSTQPNPASQTANGNLQRVLLMDDDLAILRFSSVILERAGYQVALAEEGSVALRLYDEARRETRPFDAVVMDLTIPGGMGGKVAVREILKLDPNARVIVCSGYSNDPVMSDYKAYGFRARLAKPFKGEELHRVLAEVIRD